MGDRDLHLRRGQRRRQGRVDVARDDHQVGPLLGQHRLEPLHHPRRLLGVAAGADLEHVVGRGHAQLLEEDLRHQPVVVLAGVDDRVPSLGQSRPQSADHRRRLDEVGPGPDHVDDAHRAAQYPALRLRPAIERALSARASASIADPMPKMKTHSGAKKRFRKTATGKLRGRRAYSSHILEKKSPKRKRRMARPVEIAPSDTKTVRHLLGGGK